MSNITAPIPRVVSIDNLIAIYDRTVQEISTYENTSLLSLQGDTRIFSCVLNCYGLLLDCCDILLCINGQENLLEPSHTSIVSRTRKRCELLLLTLDMAIDEGDMNREYPPVTVSKVGDSTFEWNRNIDMAVMSKEELLEEESTLLNMAACPTPEEVSVSNAMADMVQLAGIESWAKLQRDISAEWGELQYKEGLTKLTHEKSKKIRTE